MFQRLSSTLLRSNQQLSVVAKRSYQGILYQFGPPKNKISNGELFVMGAVFVLGIMGPGIYIAANMQEYNGKAAARREAGK